MTTPNVAPADLTDTSARKSKAKAGQPVLAKAFASGNAEVHELRAEREAAVSNADAERVAAVDAKLAALGYEI